MRIEKNGKISDADYVALKGQADNVRQNYSSSMTPAKRLIVGDY